ncbi:MAG: hypothetical protein EXX96DRAFT_459097, partial [Benjaminiella poitrasii]
KDSGSVIIDGTFSRLCILKHKIACYLLKLESEYFWQGRGFPPISHPSLHLIHRRRSALIMGNHRIGSLDIFGRQQDSSEE